MQVSVYQIMSNLGFINHLYGYIIMSMGKMCIRDSRKGEAGTAGTSFHISGG